MKTLLLAALVAAVPSASFAQSDKPKQKAEPGVSATAALATENLELDIPAAQGLLNRIKAVQKALYDTALSYLSKAGAAKDAAKDAGKATGEGGKAAAAGEIATAASLEAAGLRLEELYSKAVYLRVKPAAVKLAMTGSPENPKELIAASTAVEGVAALRLKLVNAQLEGGAASVDVVAYKISMAEIGTVGGVPSNLVDRLMKAASEISKAKAALDSATAVREPASPRAAHDAGGGQMSRTSSKDK